MAQFYLDPHRESDPYALPDAEAFLVDDHGYLNGEPFTLPHEPGDEAMGLAEAGWYWWPCLPGCLPDNSDPSGPFSTEQQAVEDARN